MEQSASCSHCGQHSTELCRLQTACFYRLHAPYTKPLNNPGISVVRSSALTAKRAWERASGWYRAAVHSAVFGSPV